MIPIMIIIWKYILKDSNKLKGTVHFLRFLKDFIHLVVVWKANIKVEPAERLNINNAIKRSTQ